MFRHIFFYSNFSALDERILSGFVPFGTVYTHESLLKMIKFGQVLRSNTQNKILFDSRRVNVQIIVSARNPLVETTFTKLFCMHSGAIKNKQKAFADHFVRKAPLTKVF